MSYGAYHHFHRCNNLPSRNTAFSVAHTYRVDVSKLSFDFSSITSCFYAMALLLPSVSADLVVYVGKMPTSEQMRLPYPAGMTARK